MKKYNPVDWCAVRTPFLSVAQGLKFSQDSHSVWAALDNQDFDRILHHVAPELRQKAQNARKIQDPEILEALYEVICRLSRRSQPYSLMAGLSFCRFEKLADQSKGPTPTVQIVLSDQAEYQISKLTADPKNSKPLSLQLNSTAMLSGDHVSWWAPPSDESQGWIKRSISLPKRQIKVLQNGQFNLIPLEIRNQLINANLIWKKNAEAQLNRAEIKSFAEADDFSAATSKSRLELFKPARQSHISTSSLNQLLKAALALREFQQADFSYRQRHQAMEKITKDFKETYDYECIPFLQFMEDNDLKLKKTFEELNSTRRNPQFDAWLSNRLDKLDLKNNKVLSLTASDLENFRQSMSDDQDDSFYPPTLTVISKMTQPKQQWWLQTVIANNPIGYFSRHMHMDMDLKNGTLDLVQKFCDQHQGALVADLLHWSPKSRVRAIMPENDFFSAKILVSRASHQLSPCQEVQLQDLFIFARGLRLCLFSKSLQQEVVPTLSHLYNYKNDRNIIFRFLCGLTVQNSPVASVWHWGNLHVREFLPRVEFEKIILAPARWRVPTAALLGAVKKEDLDSLRKALQVLKIPKLFSVVDLDRRLFFDQSSDLSMQSLVNLMHKFSFIIIEEYLEPDGVTGPEGPYEHDFIIPFLRPEAQLDQASLRPPSTPQLKPKQIIFSPGSEWTQYNIYLRASLTTSFLTKILKPFVKSNLSQNKWFYLLYRAPFWHIRLRIQGACHKLDIFLHKLIQNKTILSFSLETYRREIERYGGLEGCVVFETLSSLDSQSALDTLALSHHSSLSKSELWSYSAFYSAWFYLKAFGFENEVETYRKSIHNVDVHGPLQVVIKKVLGQIRRVQLGHEMNADPQIKTVELIYLKRYQKQKQAVKKLLKLVENKKLSCSLPHYVESLIHLSLNRLDADLTNGHETLVLKTIFDIQNSRNKRLNLHSDK